VRLAGRYVVEFVLRYRELIAPHIRDIVASVLFMEVLAVNTDSLPLAGDGGWSGATSDDERTTATGALLAERLGIPDETVRRRLLDLCAKGNLTRRREGYFVPGALLNSAPFGRFFAANHRNVVRLFGQLASFDALGRVQPDDRAGRLEAG
jgi:hypothetical protein